MELADRFLVVQRASVGSKGGFDIPGMSPEPGMGNVPIPKPIMPAGVEPVSGEARILLMLNMVTTDDLTDDQEYQDLYDDIKEECAGFGEVEDLRIPRPVKKDRSRWGPGEAGGQSALDAVRADEAAGVGRVYVKYRDPSSAGKALNSLAGRSFAGRSIIATLLSEDDPSVMPPLNLIFASQPPPPTSDPAPPPPPMEY